MKKTTLLLIFLSAMQMLNAQGNINYNYDTAGNRLGRSHSSSATADNATSPEEMTVTQLDQLVKETQQLTENESKTLEENEYSIAFNLYPNPATDKVTLVRTNNAPTQGKTPVIILLDAQGNILDKLSTNDATITFDISHLAKGMYYVFYFGCAQQPNVSKDEKKAWRVVKE